MFPSLERFGFMPFGENTSFFELTLLKTHGMVLMQYIVYHEKR